MKNKSNLIIFIIVVILAILLIWPALSDTSEDNTATENDDVTTTDDSAMKDKDSDAVMVDKGSSVTVTSPVMTDDKVMTSSVTSAPSSTMLLQAYFPGTQVNPENLDCALVYATPRFVARTSAPARAVLMELFKGVTSVEAAQGVATAINPGVKINSLTINSGIARVDLSSELTANVAGSCRVTAIRSQIENTLKQFSTVKSVVISVNGVNY